MTLTGLFIRNKNEGVEA